MKTKLPSMNTGFQSLRVAICLGTTSAFLLVGGCVSDRYTRSTGETVDDRTAAAHVKSALGDDPMYKFPLVQVKTFKGTVQLSGFVLSEDQKNRAGEIAQRSEGVQSVENRISVQEGPSYNPTVRGSQSNPTVRDSQSNPNVRDSQSNPNVRDAR